MTGHEEQPQCYCKACLAKGPWGGMPVGRAGCGEPGSALLDEERSPAGGGVCFCSGWMHPGEGWERLLSLGGRREGCQGRDKTPDKFGLAGELIS